MKRIALLAMLFVCGSVFAQTTSEEFKARCERQTRNVGAAGVGVETIINKWEEAFPDDPEMLVARFSYNFAKAQTVDVVPMSLARYLGQKPTFTLKDSEGRDVNYFEVKNFDDDCFAAAMTALDRAVELNPMELRYRFLRITALIDYEQGSPDMAMSQLNALIDMNAKKAKWTFDGSAVEDSTFSDAMTEYSYSLYKLGTDASYEAFRTISEKMLKQDPNNTIFINNLGSYYQVVKKNNKQAAKYYNKTLKLEPDNYAAQRNLRLMQTSQSKKGQSSK